jgi:copper(I)-binding protein
MNSEEQTLAEGQTVPLTLTFAKAGTIQIDVRVEKSGDGSGSGMMHGKGMDHGMPDSGLRREGAPVRKTADR